MCNLLKSRREALRGLPWLRPLLLVFDLALLVIGYFVSPNIGLAIGVLAIVVNELFSPVAIQRIFLKDLCVQSNVTASINKKAIRSAGEKEPDV